MMNEVLCLDTAPLVAAPVFPNSVRWSEENLLAAAAGHLVTIFSPSSLSGPRGYVTLPRGPEQAIGEICNEDASKQSVLSLRLRKEVQTQVRSIDWSPQGFAPDAGCLLAVCTSAHDVKIFRRPTSELTSEWVEAVNITAIYHEHCKATGFKDAGLKAVEYAKDDAIPLPDATWQYRRGWQTKPQTKPRQVKAPSKPGKVPGRSKKTLEITKATAEAAGEEGAAKRAKDVKAGGLMLGETLIEAEAQKGGEVADRVQQGEEVRLEELVVDGEGRERGAAVRGIEERLALEGEVQARTGELGLEIAGGVEGSKDGDERTGAGLESQQVGLETQGEDQRQEELRLRKGNEAFVAAERDLGEDSLAGKKFSAEVDWTRMLLNAEVDGEGGAAGKELGEGDGKTVEGGAGDEQAALNLKEGSALLDKGEGAEGGEELKEGKGPETSGQVGAEDTGGKKRGRAADSASDANPRATKRRSTRQRTAGSNNWGEKGGLAQDGDMGGGPVADFENRGGRRRPVQKRASVLGGEVQGSVERVDPEGASAQKDLVAENQKEGGDVAESGLLDFLLGRDDAAMTSEVDERGQTDTLLENKQETSQVQNQSNVPVTINAGEETAKTSENEEVPSWQLGPVSGPVLSTDDVTVRSRVEVLQAEEGLRGAWFAGTVVKLSGRKKAQVQYDELLEKEETGEKLREWIPLPPVQTVGIGGLSTGCEKPKPRKRIKVTKGRGRKPAVKPEEKAAASATCKTVTRPRVRPEVPIFDIGDRKYAPGDHVEASLNDAWWEGLVVGLTKGGGISVFFPGDGDVQEFDPEKLRLAWEVQGSELGWAPYGAKTAPEKLGSRGKGVEKGVNKRSGKVTRGVNQGRGKAKTGVKQESVEENASEANGKGAKRRRRRYKHKVGDERLTTGGLTLPKVEAEGGYEMASLGAEEKAKLTREHERLGGLLCERFRVLREKQPVEKLPEYDGREHLKDLDRDLLEQAIAEMVAQEGDQLAAARLTVKELVKIGRRHIREKVVKTRKQRPPRERKPKPEPKEGEMLGPRKRKRVDYVKLGGGEDHEIREGGGKPEAKKETKRKGKARADQDKDFAGNLASDSDEPIASKPARKRKRQKKPPSDLAVERRKERDRIKSQQKRDAKQAEKLASVVKLESKPRLDSVTAAVLAARSDLLAALTVSWSPRCGGSTPGGSFTVLAVGSKSSHVALWRISEPLGDAGTPGVTFLGTLLAHDSWVSALGWAYQKGPVEAGSVEKPTENERQSAGQGLLILGTGSSDGSVRLWSLAVGDSGASGVAPLVIQPAGQVCSPTGEVVTSLSLQAESDVLNVAVARGAGELLIWTGPVLTRGANPQPRAQPRVASARPSGQPLMGLGWSAEEGRIFTCSQESGLQRWQLDGESGLLPVTIQVTAGNRQFGLSVPTARMMRGYAGLALSPNGLAIAGVRTLALGSLDTMYQAKAMRGALQVMLCGMGEGGGVKREVGKKPRWKLGAAAQAAIEALTAGRENTGKRDWLEEFLTPGGGGTENGLEKATGGQDREKVPQTETGEEEKESPPGNAAGGEVRKRASEMVNKSEDAESSEPAKVTIEIGEAGGEEDEKGRVERKGTAEVAGGEERRRGTAERLKRDVLSSVERMLGGEGPLILWDVVTALGELGADALQQVLAKVRGFGVREQGVENGSVREGPGLGEGEEGARGMEPGLRASEENGERGTQGKQTGLGNHEGEAVNLGSEVPRGGEEVSPSEGPKRQEKRGLEAGNGEEARRRALQILQVLLLKLGATLERDDLGENGASQLDVSDISSREAGFHVEGGAGKPTTSQCEALGEQEGPINPELNPGLSIPKGWEAELRRVESELRLLQAQVLLGKVESGSGPVTGSAATSALLWADWAQGQGALAGLRFEKLAENLYDACGTRSASPGPREICPLCSSPVPFESPDTACCSYTSLPGTGFKAGVKGHKFKRCLMTMLIHTVPASWQCSCCLRICSMLPESLVEKPVCSFCGVLMHRPLPKAFLNPALC